METQGHLIQAEHNFNFHNSIEKVHPEHYFDWKVTCLFYIAVHYMRAYIISKGKNPGSTHGEIEKLISPNFDDAKLKVSKTCWNNYRNLYLYSRTARYEGFIDIEGFTSDRKKDHYYCCKHLNDLKLYLIGRGLEIEN